MKRKRERDDRECVLADAAWLQLAGFLTDVELVQVSQVSKLCYKLYYVQAFCVRFWFTDHVWDKLSEQTRQYVQNLAWPSDLGDVDDHFHFKQLSLNSWDIDLSIGTRFVSRCSRLRSLFIRGCSTNYLHSLPETVTTFGEIADGGDDRTWERAPLVVPLQIQNLILSVESFTHVTNLHSNLMSLKIGSKYGPFDEPSFSLSMRLPENLTTLKISAEITTCITYFPSSLRKLKLTQRYSHPLLNLPESLVYLSISYDSDQPIRLPHSLQVLKCHSDKSLNELPPNLLKLEMCTTTYILPLKFPSKLRSLEIICDQMRELLPGMLPSSLRYFYLSARTRIADNALPCDLDKLALGSMCDSLVCAHLPVKLRKLVLKSNPEFLEAFPDSLQVFSLGYCVATFYPIPKNLMRLKLCTREQVAHYRQPGMVSCNVVIQEK
jgi:hypothetical protein